MLEKLIVPFDKKRLKEGVGVCFVMSLVYFFFYLFIGYLRATLGHYLVFMIIQVLSVIVIAMFLLIAFYGLYLLLSNRKAAVLDQKGIWVNFYGFIPWKEIDEMYIYYPKLSYGAIGICLKDFGKLSNQVSFFVRIWIPFAQWLGRRPHINISTVAMQNNEILDFAYRYLKNE